MSEKVRQLVALVDHYRFARSYPELTYVIKDALDGRLSDTDAEHYLLFLQDRAAELDRVPTHLLECPGDDELNAEGPPDVVLGNLRDDPDVPNGLRIEARPRSVIVAGAVGSGKSTAIRRMTLGIDAFARKRGRPVSILIFDRKASEYGDLPRRLGHHWRHFSVHEGAWLGLNGPRDMPAHVWTSILCTIFAAAAGLVAGTAVLAHAIAWLLPRLNAQPTARRRWPDFRLLLDVLSKAPQLFSRKPEYAQSLSQQLEAVIDASGELFETSHGLDVNQDIIAQGQSAVFDIGNLQPPFLRMFVVWLILAQVLFARMHQKHRVDTTEVVAVIDEADQDVSREMEARFPDGLSPIGNLLQNARETGVGAIIGLHSLANTSRSVLANAPYHLMMNLSDEHSIAEASRTLLLPRGAERIFPALKPGEYIFRAAQSGWSHPVLAVVDPVPSNRDTTLPTYDHHMAVPAVRLADVPQLDAALSEASKQHRTARMRAAPAVKRDVSDQGRNLLDAWSLHPFTPVARLWDSLKVVSFATQQAVRDELAGLKLAKFKDWRIGKVNVGLMELTKEGWAFLRKNPPRLRGRGEIEHRHATHWIVGVLRKQGGVTHIEWTVPGTSHTADVAHQGDDCWHAYEVIVTSKDNIVSHIQACLLTSKDVKSVTIVAGTKVELRKYKAKIAVVPSLRNVQSRVRYEPVDTYRCALFG